MRHVISAFVSHTPRVMLVTSLLALAAIASQTTVLAKNKLCTLCPVPGVDSSATQSLGGAAKTGGPCTAGHGANGFPIPDPNCTPGAFNPTVTVARFGDKKFKTACVRDCLTDASKKKTTYGNYQAKQNSSCELDHLVPLEMGGADSLDNIWPQCGKAPNGKNYKDIKDQVEQYLTVQVVLGLDLDKARKGIATDWTQFIDDAAKFCAKQSCDIQNYRK